LREEGFMFKDVLKVQEIEDAADYRLEGDKEVVVLSKKDYHHIIFTLNQHITELKRTSMDFDLTHHQQRTIEFLNHDLHRLRVKYDATKQQRDKFLYEDIPKLEAKIKDMEE